MYYNNGPYGGGPYGGGRRGGMASRYQYQPLQQGMMAQPASLIGKVMGLMAFAFAVALVGMFVGSFVVTGIGTYLFVAIAGLVVLIALRFTIQRTPINLILLYLFTLLEGMAISPIIGYYLATSPTILGEAFFITAVTTLALSIYAWTTHRDFSRLGDYLFFGLILLIVAGFAGLLFGGFSNLVVLIISVIGVAIFSGYVLFYVQRAKYMADTLPNAIGLTVSLFITVLNLFLYILEILAILQGGGRRR